MAAKIYLNIVDPLGSDSIIAPEKLPAFEGRDDENLACGSCKNVIGRNVSTRAIFRTFTAESRLLVKCTCGAHNLIPTSNPS